MLLLSQDFGITCDEPFHYQNGEDVVGYFASFTKERAYHRGNLRYYGPLFDVLAYATEKLGVFSFPADAHHFINAIFGWIAVVFAGLIAASIADVWAGILAMLLLFGCPAFLGQTMNNPKDIPFAALATATLYFMIRLQKDPPHFSRENWRHLAVVAALALLVRVGALLFLYEFLLLLMGVHWLSGKWSARSALGHAKDWIVCLLTAIVIVTVFWPLAQEQPLFGPFKAFHYFSRFKDFDGPTLFMGEYVRPSALPWNYLPVYLLAQTPEFILAGLVIGVLLLLSKGRDSVFKQSLSIVLFFAFFPVFAAIVARASLYDGFRHFLFVYPALVVVSALG